MPKTLIRLLKSGQQIQAHSGGKQLSSRKKPSLNSSNSKGDDRKSSVNDNGAAVSSRRKGQRDISKRSDDGGKKDGQPPLKRQKGESLKAYLERIDVESNARIMDAYRKSRVQSERRKRCVCH